MQNCKPQTKPKLNTLSGVVLCSKIKFFITGVIVFVLLTFCGITAFAEEPIVINSHANSLQTMPLAQLAVENEENIVLIDNGSMLSDLPS